MVFVKHHQVWKVCEKKTQRISCHQGLGCYTEVIGILSDRQTMEFWTKDLPCNSCGATISKQQRDFQLLSCGAHMERPTPEEPNSFDDTINHLSLEDQWTIDEIDGPQDTGKFLAKAMVNNQALAVSDRLHKKTQTLPPWPF